MNLPIKQFTRRVEQTPQARRRLERRLLQLIDKYFEDPDRRDGRGRKSRFLRKVEKALRQLTHATGWQRWEDLDPNVRQEAKALVRTACHGQESFEALMNRVSALRGRVNRAGHVRKARQPIEGCDALREGLPQGFAVERLHTVGRLAKAGRQLGNCAKNNGYGLHDKLRQRESDFYLVLRGDDAVAMFEADLESGKITEFRDKRNDDEVELPRCVLLDLQRCLALDGDEVWACLQQGAASVFATVSGEIDNPDWFCKNVKVWCGARRLVIWERGKRRRPDQWSSFKWEGANWVATDASSRTRLDALMTRHPSIAKLAHGVAKPRARPKT